MLYNVDLRVLMAKSLERDDKKRGASYVPSWVNDARCRGDRVRMHEMDYWINYTNRVPYNRKLTPKEWAQVKIFNLPKKTLGLQVEPKHLDVFLSTVKLIKPRKYPYSHITLQIDLDEHEVIYLNNLYGRFDDSNSSDDFELIRAREYGDFGLMYEYTFKEKYNITVYQYVFNENK